MLDKLKDLDLRYEDLESQLGDPRVYGDAEKLRQVNRELKELLPVVELLPPLTVLSLPFLSVTVRVSRT